MRWVLCVILLFSFLAWDIAGNNGHYTHLITDALDISGENFTSGS
jgi:hypothetical protein